MACWLTCKRGMEGNRTVIKVWKGVSVFSTCIQGVDTALVMIEIVNRTIVCQFQTPVKSRVTLNWLPVPLITITYLDYSFKYPVRKLSDTDYIHIHLYSQWLSRRTFSSPTVISPLVPLKCWYPFSILRCHIPKCCGILVEHHCQILITVLQYIFKILLFFPSC